MMVSKKVPKHLWDYGLVRQDGIISRIAYGKTEEARICEVSGQTSYISEWIDFDLYDLWSTINFHLFF